MKRYRLLLRAFPARVRREDGDEMTRLFEEQLRAARAAGRGTARLWLHAIADALVYGGLERTVRTRAAARDARLAIRRWRWWMHALVTDLRFAARLLIGQPFLTAVTLVILAIGVGANTAIYSSLDAVLLRPLPYDEPERLVMVWEKRPAENVLNNVVAPADYVDWVRMNDVFESMAAVAPATVDLTGSGEPLRVPALAVSPAFFDVLRVRPALGRTFRPGDDRVGNHRVVILSHGLWAERFGADPAIVGRAVLLNGTAHEVIGVLPASFEFVDATIRLWAPLPVEGGPQPPSRANHEFQVYARLAPGVTLAQARDGMNRVAAQLSERHPETNARHGAWVSMLHDEVAAPVRGSLLFLMGAVGFVLLLACVNVASLLLARAVARRREMAVRSALGAGRARLVGQALTESLLLGLLGGVASVIVAYWGIELLRQITPQGLPVPGLRRIALDRRVLAFGFSLSLVAGVVFGMLPAWQVAKQNTMDGLRDGGRSMGLVRTRSRAALVVCEVALAALLLAGAGLLLRSFQTLLQAEPGFRTEGVLTAAISLPGARYAGEERLRLAVEQIEERFRGIPGVRAVGATSHLPLTGADSRRGIAVEGYEPAPGDPTRAHWRIVTPGYFAAMGVQLVEGRTFTADDRGSSPLVAIVNETMARRYWPDRSPIGHRFSFVGSPGALEVVGVVRDVRHWGIDAAVNPEMYVSHRQVPFGRLAFTIATDGEPSALAAAVREGLRVVDPDLPLASVRTMEEVAAQSLARRRSTLVLLSLFAVIALVLAGAGIYAVMSQIVALRRGEIGVRLSLGAEPAGILKLVLGEALVQAAAGLAIGLAAAVLLMRMFRSQLFGVGPGDPATLATVALLLLATSVAACLVPARRAMRVDPVETMRGSR
jgi:putative ABC transport system permease protein